MPLYDFKCEKCGYEFDALIESNLITDEFRIECASCETVSAKRIFKRAPFARVGGDGSDRQIKAMQRSFDKRFVKKELPDVRHKFGKTFDDSLIGGAKRRIKENKSD